MKINAVRISLIQQYRALYWKIGRSQLFKSIKDFDMTQSLCFPGYHASQFKKKNYVELFCMCTFPRSSKCKRNQDLKQDQPCHKKEHENSRKTVCSAIHFFKGYLGLRKDVCSNYKAKYLLIFFTFPLQSILLSPGYW